MDRGMTDEQARELGLRAMMAGFRWVHPCLTGGAGKNARYLFTDDDGWIHSLRPSHTGSREWVEEGGECWPDFRDPATLGVLVSQCRERTGGLLWASPDGDGWLVNHAPNGRDDGPVLVNLATVEPTEAEAWVAALEGAP